MDNQKDIGIEQFAKGKVSELIDAMYDDEYIFNYDIGTISDAIVEFAVSDCDFDVAKEKASLIVDAYLSVNDSDIFIEQQEPFTSSDILSAQDDGNVTVLGVARAHAINEVWRFIVSNGRNMHFDYNSMAVVIDTGDGEQVVKSGKRGGTTVYRLTRDDADNIAYRLNNGGSIYIFIGGDIKSVTGSAKVARAFTVSGWGAAVL